MNWHKVGKLLPQKVDQVHFRAQIDGAQVCRLWREYAAQFFLSKIMDNHEAINFRDGILVIAVNIPRYLPEIKTQQHQIVQLINRALECSLVKRICYKV